MFDYEFYFIVFLLSNRNIFYLSLKLKKKGIVFNNKSEKLNQFLNSDIGCIIYTDEFIFCLLFTYKHILYFFLQKKDNFWYIILELKNKTILCYLILKIES